MFFLSPAEEILSLGMTDSSISASSPSFPAFPPSLRLATTADLYHITNVLTQAFTEPVGPTNYHIDDWDAKRGQPDWQVEQKGWLVVVAEDQYDPEERARSKVAIPSDYDTQHTTGHTVVIGVAVWKLAKNSCVMANSGDRDKVRSLEHFPAADGVMELNSLAIHPSYWSRKHATRLVRWDIDLAKVDEAIINVMALKMAKDFYLAIGFDDVDPIPPSSGTATPHAFRSMRYTPQS